MFTLICFNFCRHRDRGFGRSSCTGTGGAISAAEREAQRCRLLGCLIIVTLVSQLGERPAALERRFLLLHGACGTLAGGGDPDGRGRRTGTGKDQDQAFPKIVVAGNHSQAGAEW